ncbi:kinase-like domain-containing protein [Pseudomassariella vexata]|uniref:Kinase-like domain-containing protein n=1 Tax=Pseudomassariella vexata TaxID=1141098 RepID=A0A1Y2DPM0_9PEZI|nr:kinase-like domain-containing protein [Pseudomassariella vexata]ORY61228.1 kinase-like domain-containing protein [Pseudomassariella vexata]
MGNSQGKPVDLNGEVNLNHFRLLRVVGRGAFGKVRIVERKDTGLAFALKYIRKDEVVRSESVRNIIRERRMLEHVNHPFICNLRYSFQDIEYMYLVVDLMSGGDLRFHISRKTFTEEAVRFWIAELGCALRYIHGQGIIHRDVKPDNVLLDADGHVHLTDFNVASDVIPGRVLSSKSGTLAYLGPEVYAGKGYTVTADWWSLGVLFYECIYNKRPFEGNSESSLTNIILAANPKFPITSPPVSLPCLYAIREALRPDPNERMGHTWESFTQHEFFQVIDFEALERKEVAPEFIPSADKTNFDATYDLEELLLEEAPLEARARRQKPRERLKDDATDKEIREEELYRSIERDFQPFDYTVAAYQKITAMQQGGTYAADPSQINGQTNIDTQGQALSTNEAVAAPSTNCYKQATHGVYQPEPLQRQPSTGFAHANKGQRAPGRPAPLPPYPNSYTNRGSFPSGMRVESPTGGVQVTIDAGGSWSQLARQDATLPTDAQHPSDDKAGSSSSGVFGFFGRKKGRGHSPKPKERGVLGKEGARIVIG